MAVRQEVWNATLDIDHGWVLIGVMFACIAFISILTVLSGHGGLMVDYRGAGWQATFMPVPYLVAFCVAAVVGFIAIFKLWRKRRSRKSDTSNSPISPR
jgi:membrane protein implicated in regulation of membrane protease activity